MSLNKTIPKVIKKLNQRVVNRIAAGEVIHRPYNVVKELIENSLDANSTSIEVTVKDGGMKSIVIQDNGSGIGKQDLDIVCERFTTSKLEEFEDLLQINTYGFRGEALASISHVSYLTITTKTDDQLCGYKMQFIDGIPKSNVVPLAANNGTIILVENLFYNLLMRKNALNSYSNEYNLILDLITKYAIHNSNSVSFSLKKVGENNCDLNTSIGNKFVDNIRSLYGSNIANNLIEISFSDESKLQFSLSAFISNLNIHQKNFVFILFINNRLVECNSLKKGIDLIYSNHLMKGLHPFVYLSLTLEAKHVDVNIHPTKSEVHFLHEQEICQKIIELIESKLSNGETRRLTADKSLNKESQSSEEFCKINTKLNKNETSVKSREKTPKESNKQTPVRPQKQIRTDCKDRKIDEFLVRTTKVNTKRREIRLKSVLDLRKSVAEVVDNSLQDIICRSSYVGCVDETFILIQFETQLLLVNGYRLNRELFYQLFLIDFANFSQIKFSKPLLISEVINMYLDYEKQTQNPNTQNIGIKEIEEILMNNREMLFDYFSININSEKQLTGLPVLLEGLVPNLAHLPQFLYCLAKDVNWKAEKECFESVGRVLSEFYAKPQNKFECDSDQQKWAKIVESIIYPTYKAILCPPKSLTNYSTFFVTTNLSDLYKVFERC